MKLFAKNIIFATGSTSTLAILERSGIGSPRVLEPLGIQVKYSHPGVGENLQDHMHRRVAFRVKKAKTLNQKFNSIFGNLGMGIEYLISRSGPLCIATSQLGAFFKSSESMNRADLKFHVQPLTTVRLGAKLHYFPDSTADVSNVRPLSTGSIHIQSELAIYPSSIDSKYLSTKSDRNIAVKSIERAREIFCQKSLRECAPVEFKPGVRFITQSDILRSAGDIGTTIFHPFGTAKMGSESDHYSVVDHKLRVHELDGLFIADASIMPSIISGITNATKVMIAQSLASRWKEIELC